MSCNYAIYVLRTLRFVLLLFFWSAFSLNFFVLTLSVVVVFLGLTLGLNFNFNFNFNFDSFCLPTSFNYFVWYIAILYYLSYFFMLFCLFFYCLLLIYLSIISILFLSYASGGYYGICCGFSFKLYTLYILWLVRRSVFLLLVVFSFVDYLFIYLFIDYYLLLLFFNLFLLWSVGFLLYLVYYINLLFSIDFIIYYLSFLIILNLFLDTYDFFYNFFYVVLPSSFYIVSLFGYICMWHLVFISVFSGTSSLFLLNVLYFSCHYNYMGVSRLVTLLCAGGCTWIIKCYSIWLIAAPVVYSGVDCLWSCVAGAGSCGSTGSSCNDGAPASARPVTVRIAMVVMVTIIVAIMLLCAYILGCWFIIIYDLNLFIRLVVYFVFPLVLTCVCCVYCVLSGGFFPHCFSLLSDSIGIVWVVGLIWAWSWWPVWYKTYELAILYAVFCNFYYFLYFCIVLLPMYSLSLVRLFPLVFCAFCLSLFSFPSFLPSFIPVSFFLAFSSSFLFLCFGLLQVFFFPLFPGCMERQLSPAEINKQNDYLDIYVYIYYLF